MGLIQERDCSQLGSAGHVARKRGLLAHGKSLTCDYLDCNQVNCIRAENPSFRTIYISGKPSEPISPLESFYNKLQRHQKIVQSNKH